MENIKILTHKELAQITNHRSGEIKFGEKLILIPEGENAEKFLKNSSAQFVLVGLPEAIGVKANYGRPGTASAYFETLKSLANIQHNKFCKGNNLIALGHLNVKHLVAEAELLDIKNKDHKKRLFEIVSIIDKEVSHLIHTIINTGKIPIIVGGGHNNAYGNIKGLALAKGKPVNVVNFDAHTDFRALEGRHSGNGFSYALENGFLNKYFIFGIHENYTSKSVYQSIKEVKDRVYYSSYDEIEVRKTKNFETELQAALDFVKYDSFGIEVDLDAIAGVYSSAMTLSGFSAQQARNFVHFLGQHKNASYIHICEGAPDLDESINNHLTGKLIAYLITDFMKSKTL